MSSVDRRRIENNTDFYGVQRDLRKDKVTQVKNYLTSIDATFPNSIILNTTSSSVISESDDYLEFNVDPNTFTIIDGQHRVEGFKDANNDLKSDFELIVTIFKDLSNDKQSKIFTIINSTQTKVDPTLYYNLELNRKEYTPAKMMTEIAQSFNYDSNSPLFKVIKLISNKSTDNDKKIISLASFVKPLLSLTYPESDYYKIDNMLTNSVEFPNFDDISYDDKRYPFWTFYKKRDFDSVYKILFNYFAALKVVFKNDWLNSESLLNKTTGYNALMMLFRELFIKGVGKGTLTSSFFESEVDNLRKMDGTINTSKYGASGDQASKALFDDLKRCIQGAKV